jgi:NTE family protein
MAGAVSGGFRRSPTALLDNAPLAGLLGDRVDFTAIQRCIDRGDLYALSVTVSGYTSGQSVSFFQGAPGLQPWKRARRIGAAMDIGLEHLLASSALPFIFPPVRINREYFGDGSMRQIAPISPALHLGADRVLVIGVGRQLQAPPERVKVSGYPTLAQIAGHALNSIFLDSMEVDIERMQRINSTLAAIPEELRRRGGVTLRPVEHMVITPSVDLEKIAAAHVHELPRTIRLLLGSVGAMRKSGSNLASYLLFERGYCRALIALGYSDTMARRDRMLEFLGADSGWYCAVDGPRATATAGA